MLTRSKISRAFAFAYDILRRMPPASPVSTTQGILQDRLRLAQTAFETYRTRCFWSLAPDFVVDESTLPILIAGLRKHGDRTAFQIAAQLSR